MGMTKSTNPPLKPGPGWEPILGELGRETVMVIGTPGVGKSWLARYLAEGLAQRGWTVGLVSADPGQAAVGVPACLGLSLSPRWSEVTAQWFVGNRTPVGHLLPMVVGTARLVERARASGAQAVILDPTGLAEGPLARVLKYHKAVAAGVNQVIALQRGEELEPLLALLEGLCLRIHRLRPVPEARDRTPEARKRYREERFRTHLQDGQTHLFRRGLVLGRDWQLGPPSEEQRLEANTLVGLLDRPGYCLALGLVQEVHAESLVVYTAWREVPAVARVQVGNLRVSRQGEELP
jgi:polynucleotide 5'-hydroxyl-kinase GRC3/NOL9